MTKSEDEFWEGVEDGAMFWVDAFNPVGTFQLAMNPTVHGFQDWAVKKAAVAGVFGSTAYLLHMASSPHARTPVSLLFKNAFWIQQGMKQQIKRQIVGGLARAGVSLAGLTPAALVMGAVGGIFYGADQLIQNLTSGATGLWPDENFMNWHGQ